MLHSFTILVAAATLASSAVVPRQASSGQTQAIPNTAPADDTFNNGKPVFIGLPGQSPPNADSDGVYGTRETDLPFNRLYTGTLKFFSEGQLNSPNGTTDKWIDQGGTDSATQSACGIPDNAYYISKVAIHPYFLKYADLSRYCMQDVCISFWKEDWSTDMMLKVTDICSTDPNDPTHCETPGDIKIDRSKAKVWSGHGNDNLEDVPELMGNSHPDKSVWFFMKCWADGTVQPAYTDNWFAQPPLINNLEWAQKSATDQYSKNQISYLNKGWPTYANGAYNPSGSAAPISDWTPGQEPGYTPIAGGKGFGSGGGSGAKSPPSSGSNAGAPAAKASSASPAKGTGMSTPSGKGQGGNQSGGQGGVQSATRPKPSPLASNLEFKPIEQTPTDYRPAVKPAEVELQNGTLTGAASETASGPASDAAEEDDDECDAEQ